MVAAHVAFLLRSGTYAPCIETAANSMMRLMLAQIRVWIECAECGPIQKLERQVILPFEGLTPMLERTGAICDHCRGLAIMCFERIGTRVH